MIKLIKKLIFPTLLLLIVLAFYLLDKDIKKYSQIIEEQQTIIEEHEVIMLSHQNIFLFQGSRLRDLDIRVGKLLTRTYARYE
jgi:hypothetical protein|tara:strand:+ start:2892 stop:3140 length:249 start_codon:yes stop_codon:yes gene_type:complete